MSVDGKDFGEEVGRVDEAREKYKTEVDRLQLFRTNRRSRKTNRTLIFGKQERG